QLGRLAHSTFLGLSHPPAIELAARLVALAPGRLERVFFSENGAASVEVALKMAYSYWRHRGEERPTFVRLENAYHGDTIGAVSIGGIDRFHETYRPLYHGHSYSGNPLCCAAALANLDVFEAEGTLAALPAKVQALAGLLKPLADHPHVGEVRQRGLMVGIELVADRATKEPFP